MPWVTREVKGPVGRARRKLRRWAFDHSQGLIAAGIGLVIIAAVVAIVRVLVI